MDKIPFIAFESALARCERIIHRLVIIIIALIALLVVTNVLWTIYENQFGEVITTEQEITQEADNGGSNYAVGGNYVETNN